MSSKRLELALERIAPSQWERFERFASEFLVNEFPDLRTVASNSGDGGRDSELFSPHGDPTHVLQYSVTEHWAAKIRQTATRLNSSCPSAQLLTYVTNQLIGAIADSLKVEIRKNHNLHLDIRDRTYFLDRYQRDSGCEKAAECLAQDIVDPYLASKDVLSKRPAVLDSIEARAAHVYLALQLRDEVQEKGLTKLSFEALVRSVLVRTTSDKRLSRSAIKQRIRDLLPHDAPDRVDTLTESALGRLTKRAVRHWTKEDEFCLTHEESQRVTEYIASQEVEEKALVVEIEGIVRTLTVAPLGQPEIDAVVVRARRTLEKCLYRRAESFASAVAAGNMAQFGTDHLPEIVRGDLRDVPGPKGTASVDPKWIETAVREILTSNGDAISAYLRDLADAYTLLAFLRETPDVQSAVEKMFSHGEIWLDTSAILPLIAEELLEEPGQFQQMIRTATLAGVEFYLTGGVLEEVERHINRAQVCSRMLEPWMGSTPFILDAYLRSGRPLGGFAQWTEVIKGPQRPIEDVCEYLQERFGIKKRDLEADMLDADENLRFAVQEAWHEIHQKRRERFGGSIDPNSVNRLSRHDSENYVGVIQRRKQEQPSALGYSSWWLTLDKGSLGISETLKTDFGIASPPDSPIMSVDFLAQYLTFGPLRHRVPKSSLRGLPLIEPSLVAVLTRELIVEANQIRCEVKDLPERLVRRRVRDHLDNARRRVGPYAQRGVETVLDEIEAARA